MDLRTMPPATSAIQVSVDGNIIVNVNNFMQSGVAWN